MFKPEQKDQQPMICNFVPGYIYYQDTGFGLAKALVNLVEWMLGWRR